MMQNATPPKQQAINKHTNYITSKFAIFNHNSLM